MFVGKQVSCFLFTHFVLYLISYEVIISFSVLIVLSLQHYCDQIDQIDASVAELEQTAYRLDNYAKQLGMLLHCTSNTKHTLVKYGTIQGDITIKYTSILMSNLSVKTLYNIRLYPDYHVYDHIPVYYASK